LDIIDPCIVETFFNLLWVAVAATLWTWWLTEHRRRHAQSLLPAVGLQLVALAVLAVILLPVISLTDDLQATTNPAETERGARAGDLQPSPDQPVHPLPLALVMLVVAPELPRLQAQEFIAQERSVVQRSPDFFRRLPARAPPEV
jgi:hypothetical protein